MDAPRPVSLRPGGLALAPGTMTEITRSPRPVALWLLLGSVMIAAMVAIGGVTRLTGSGLSITEWNVLMGAWPPLTEHDWAALFQKYQATPQYALVNTHFTLEQFKGIFWWEYAAHRRQGGFGRAPGHVHERLEHRAVADGAR